MLSLKYIYINYFFYLIHLNESNSLNKVFGPLGVWKWNLLIVFVQYVSSQTAPSELYCYFCSSL